MTTKPGWYVLITRDDGGATERTLGPYVTERLADKAAGGVGRNLDHDRFSVSVKCVPEPLPPGKYTAVATGVKNGRVEMEIVGGKHAGKKVRA